MVLEEQQQQKPNKNKKDAGSVFSDPTIRNSLYDEQ